MRSSVNENTAGPVVIAARSMRPETSWVRYGSVGALVLVIVFFAVVRMRLRNAPLERDEGEYAYMGQLILQGIPPYKLASNMKLPGTYAGRSEEHTSELQSLRHL